jgi:phenylalanyl-tRNA synthetase alpha chain
VAQHNTLIGIISSLEATATVTKAAVKHSEWVLTDEGLNVVAKGSPPMRLFTAVAAAGGDGLTAAEIADAAFDGDAKLVKIAQGGCMRNKWIKLDKASGKISAAVVIDTVEDTVQAHLKIIAGDASGGALDDKALKDLKRAKCVAAKSYTTYTVGKGSDFCLVRKKLATDLTAEMFQSGAWKTQSFKVRSARVCSFTSVVFMCVSSQSFLLLVDTTFSMCSSLPPLSYQYHTTAVQLQDERRRR